MKQKKIAIFFVFAFVSLVGAIKALEVVVGATGLPVGESRDETTKRWEEVLAYIDSRLPLHKDVSAKAIVGFIRAVLDKYGTEGYLYLMKMAASKGYLNFVSSWVSSDLFPKDNSNDIVWYVLSRSATFRHKDVFEVVIKKLTLANREEFAKDIFKSAALSQSGKMVKSLLSFVSEESRGMLIYESLGAETLFNPAPLVWEGLSPKVKGVLLRYMSFG